MKSAEIRQSFLDFFAGKDHTIVTSAPVIPHGDPTLMFTNAGMNQFKDVFLGTGTREYRRAVDAQKCIRVSGKHNDLEEVGRDTYHHTFFEMLGNWSFGDYYKAEAIEWAWQLLTEVWQLPREQLWATVFRDDDEAAELWPEITGIPLSRVLRFDEKDNFWEMGDVGPCGPCSEIHFDRGPDYCDVREKGHICAVNGGCARYIELWNLVFIQFNKDKNGTLTELPAKHIDTGAGFERLVAVLQSKSSNYDTDVFMPLIAHITDLTASHYGCDEENDIAIRVIADHIRALSFAIADGALPSNEERGYVLRRILRRASRFGRVLDTHEPFIYKLVATLVDVMGEAYPELKARHQHIARVIKAEEEHFSKTLDRGISLFEENAAMVISSQKKILPGVDAFLLHDTYGFPLDLTQLMAREKGLEVDVQGFEAAMDEQRRRSRQAAAESVETAITLPENLGKSSEFIGYDSDESESKIVVNRDKTLVLDKTPFYAESGGQVGDSGKISVGNITFRVENTVRHGDHILHLGYYEGDATASAGAKVIAQIDSERRRAVERNHTATHLLHKALKTVLGEHVQQAGSLVHPDYLRFDFTHFEKVSPEALERIDAIVNESIRINYSVHWEILPIEEARQRGAVALFGEKYDDTVRMIEVDDYSRELCGGTHVRRTGEIGYFYLAAESAVATGVRRIEAYTGERAVQNARVDRHRLQEISRLLGSAPEEAAGRIARLLDEKKQLVQEAKSAKRRDFRTEVIDLVDAAVSVADIKLIAARTDARTLDELKTFGDTVRDALKSGVGILFAEIGGKGTLLCVVTKDLVTSNRLHAGTIVKEVARITGSSGGGGPRMAQAGVKDLKKVDAALAASKEIVANLLIKV